MNVNIKAIPEGNLTNVQRTHLGVARIVAGRVPVIPASITNTVHIIGAYSMWEEKIFITPERLNDLRYTLNTCLHELAHHTSKADDGTRAHDNAISKVTAQAAERARGGKYDSCLVGVKW